MTPLHLFLLAALTGSPSPAAQPSAPAPETETAPRKSFGTVHIELQTRALPPKLARQLAEAFDAMIEARMITLGLTLESTPAADVIVQLEISQPQADTSLQIIQCIAAINGDVVVRGEVQSCMGCTAVELIERGLEVLPDAAEAMLASQREAARAAEEARALTAMPPPPSVDAPAQPARALGPVGYVGISASALGLGSTIAGAILLARGESVGDPGSATLVTTDYRPAGWALVGAGLAATVAGNVMLGVDLGLLRRRRDTARARITGVGLDASGPGLRIQGQF